MTSRSILGLIALFPLSFLMFGQEDTDISLSGPISMVEPAPAAWVFQIDNDSPAASDQDYSNGLLLRYISARLPEHNAGDSESGFIDQLFNRLPGLRDSTDRRWSLSLGHVIMTPEDLLATEPPVDDRPYAGWLFSQFCLINESSDSLRSWEFTLGIVGPTALGEDLQHTIHTLIDDYDPQGWDHQLDNEPGIGIAYRQIWSKRLLGSSDSFGMAFLPGYGVELGNVRTEVRISGELRLGWKMAHDFGTPSIPDGGGTMVPATAESFSLTFFIAPEFHAVAQDLFVDGNTGKDNSPVTREPWRSTLKVGVRVGIHNWSFGYTHVMETRSFKEQDKAHAYGSLTISRLF